MGEGEEGFGSPMRPIVVEFRPGVEKILKKIDNKNRKRIAVAIELLRFDPIPPNAVRLSGEQSYRIRIGDYRVIYTYEGRRLLITVIHLGHRREIYRNRN